MTPRTQTDAQGRVWTLDGDRWLADPDLVVTTSGKGKAREFSPGRDPGRKYDVLSAACKVEVRIAAAQRERVLFEMERIRREERERAAREEAEAARQRAVDAAADLALARRTRRKRIGRVAVVALLLVLACAGVWGMS